MRLATFLPPGNTGPKAGVVDSSLNTIRAFADGHDGVRHALVDRTITDRDLGEFALGEVTLLDPVQPTGTIYGIGLNYADHVAEIGGTAPEVPIVFVKVSGSAAPPGNPIVCPPPVKRLDYEGELVVVIGAESQIAGYCIADDVSSRDLQKREPHWIRAKGADTFCPYGPWVTTADEIPDPENLAIRTWVNGELRQDSNTSNLIFKCRELVDFIAETCTLRPGDLILTGTPGGVGQGQDPPAYLQSGDVVRIEIAGLGVIEHPVA
jgi:2-keto-4-pentenoate hydratase/2-oxohepta-3-ene-1,7-dioic acid hydratase in catechol pathway